MNYVGFHLYLVELVGSYNRTKSLRGVSLLAKKHKCACVTKEQFFEFGLHLVGGVVSRSLSDDIRDRLAKLESKCKRKKEEEVKEEVNHMLVDWDALGRKYGLVELTPVEGSPFKYALDNGGVAIDDIEDVLHADDIVRDLSDEEFDFCEKLFMAHIGNDIMDCKDGIRFICGFRIPTLCYVESGDVFSGLFFVKANNNGSSFWFCTRKEPLLLLAHFDYVVKCLKSDKEIGN